MLRNVIDGLIRTMLRHKDRKQPYCPSYSV